MNRHTSVLAAALLLAGTSAGCGVFSAEASSPVTATVAAVRGDFAVTVKARGELEAVNASPIAVPRVPTGSLKVKELQPEGALVEEGDTILVFDSTDLDIELDNHVATFTATGRKIDKTRLQWDIESDSIEVMKQVSALEREYASEFQLDDDQIYSQLEILDARLDKQNAEHRIVFADAKLLLRGEYFNIDESILDVEKRHTQTKIERVNTSLGNLVLQAPIGGMLSYRKNWRGSKVSVGDALWPGNVVMSIVDPTSTLLKVNIHEKDATGVEVGALARVRIDARTDRVFEGTVSYLSDLSSPIEQGNPSKFFEAKIDITDGDPDLLKPGMKGEVEIRVAEVADTVVVPRSAVLGKDGDYHVLLHRPGGPERRNVQLGPGDLVRVSVTEGLQGGESVLLGIESGDDTDKATGNGAAESVADASAGR